MAFQDRAESLAEKLHLGRVPRSVFVAVALALVLMIVLAGYASCASLSGGFEVRAQDAASASVSGDAGNEAVQAVEGEEGDAEKAASGQSVENVVLPSSGDGTGQLCIHVDGCVASPGVYYLPAGSRVIDAVTAAGGATEKARTDAVNLAQELQDGQQIVIPSRSESQATPSDGGAVTASGGAQGSGEGASSSGADGMVNINTATAEEFETLKGIGAATAEKIVADREANGPFSSIDDLTRVSGIGEKKLAAMRDRLCL